MTKDLRRLMYISLAISALILLAYPLRFTLLGSGISSNPGDWGTFGDYIGGIVGTLVSAAAFVGIMLTLRTQQASLAVQETALREQRRQAELEELQRLLSSTATSIDLILNEVLPRESLPPEYLTQFKKPMRLQFLIGLLASSVQAHGPNAIDARDGAALGNTRTPWLAFELSALAACLQHYRKRGGAEFIEHHYKRRYQWCVAAMHVLRILSNDALRSYFDPESYLQARGSLRPLA